MTTAQQKLADRLAQAACSISIMGEVNYILRDDERDLIVTALRAHNDMLDALRGMLGALLELWDEATFSREAYDDDPSIKAAKAAITKATGGQP